MREESESHLKEEEEADDDDVDGDERKSTLSVREK